MNKTTTIRHNVLVNEPLDSEVIAFRRQFDDHSPLDEIIHEGARRILQTAIDADAEVDAFIETHQHRRDEAGCRLVVKNGSLPTTNPMTTNPIESTFATIRLRHRKTKGNGTRRASLAMMFKLAQSASRKWRRLRSHS